MNTSHPYDLVAGLDRSDKKADLCLIDTATGQRRSQTIDTAPEALWEWLLQFPNGPGFDRWRPSSVGWTVPAHRQRERPARPTVRTRVQKTNWGRHIQGKSYICPEFTPPCKKLRCAHRDVKGDSILVLHFWWRRRLL